MMAKTSKANTLNMSQGRLIGLASLALAFIYLTSVANPNGSVTANTSAGSFAAVMAAAAIGYDYWYEKRFRLLTALALGVLAAAFYMAQFSA